MRDYASIMLNVLEYASIYLRKQSPDYAKILNASDAVHSIRSLYKLLRNYRERNVFKTLSNISVGAIRKKSNA